MASDSDSSGSPEMSGVVLRELEALTVVPQVKRPNKRAAKEHTLTAKERRIVQDIQAEHYEMIMHLDGKEVQRITQYVADHSPTVELAGDLCDTSGKRHRKPDSKQKLILERIAQTDYLMFRLRQEFPKRHEMLKKIDTNVAAKVKPSDIANLIENNSDELNSLMDYQHQEREEKGHTLEKHEDDGENRIEQLEKELNSMQGMSQANSKSTEELKKALKDLKLSWKKLLKIMNDNELLDETRCALLNELFRAAPGSLPTEMADCLKEDINFLGILVSLNIVRTRTTNKKTKIVVYSHE